MTATTLKWWRLPCCLNLLCFVNSKSSSSWTMLFFAIIHKKQCCLPVYKRIWRWKVLLAKLTFDAPFLVNCRLLFSPCNFFYYWENSWFSLRKISMQKMIVKMNQYWSINEFFAVWSPQFFNFVVLLEIFIVVVVSSSEITLLLFHFQSQNAANSPFCFVVLLHTRPLHLCLLFAIKAEKLVRQYTRSLSTIRSMC